MKLPSRKRDREHDEEREHDERDEDDQEAVRDDLLARAGRGGVSTIIVSPSPRGGASHGDEVGVGDDRDDDEDDERDGAGEAELLAGVEEADAVGEGAEDVGLAGGDDGAGHVGQRRGSAAGSGRGC